MKKNLFFIILLSFIFSTEVRRVNFIRFKSNINQLYIYNENDHLVNIIEPKTNLLISTADGGIYEGNLRAVYNERGYLILQDFFLGKGSGRKIPFYLIEKISIGEGERRRFLKNIGVSSLASGTASYFGSYLILPPNSEFVCIQGGCSSALNQQIRLFFFIPVGVVTGAITGLINTLTYPKVAEYYEKDIPPILIKQNNLYIK
jgi:hypothetical protein